MSRFDDYYILVPDKIEPVIRFAAEELVSLASLATGHKLEVCSKVLEDKPYISLGNTVKAKQLKDNLSDGELNSGGFCISTKADNNIFIVGRTDYAVLYGVYELLKIAFDIEIYSGEDICSTHKGNIDMPVINCTVNPDIEVRHIGYYNVFSNPVNAHRMRLINNDMSMRAYYGSESNNDAKTDDIFSRDIYFEVWGGLWAHTMVSQILPVERDNFGEVIHPDWYSDNLEQLCMTNQKMTTQFVSNLKRIILKKPSAPFFMLGIMDTDSTCTCENCIESDRLYGGASGTHIRFINAVARQINRWRKTALPDSTFKLVAFAYNRYRQAPVVFDKIKQTFVPVHESVVLEDNVAIMIAPLDMCGRHSITAPCNHSVYERFLGWSALTEHLVVWDYHAYFDNYLINFPSVKSIKSNVELYVKYGAKLVYNEGCLMDFTTGFHDLRIYLLSKLQWNCRLDADTLIDDFLRNYYYEAYPYLRQYFDEMENNIVRLEREYQSLGGRGYHAAYDTTWQPDVLSERHWGYDFLQRMNDLLKSAEAAMKNVGNKERRDKVTKRIQRERLSISFLLNEIHTYYCCKEEADELINDFRSLMEACGLKRFSHWGWTPEQEVQVSKKRKLFITQKIYEWECRYPARTING